MSKPDLRIYTKVIRNIDLDFTSLLVRAAYSQVYNETGRALVWSRAETGPGGIRSCVAPFAEHATYVTSSEHQGRAPHHPYNSLQTSLPDTDDTIDIVSIL